MAWVNQFDIAADRALERVRGNRAVDRLMNTATNAAEFSLIWHAASLVRGLWRGRPDQIVALAAGLGVESLVVNQGLKRWFKRQRPTTGGDERFSIRAPLTSSFPSGHASAAMFATTVLTAWDGKKWLLVWALPAAVVAISRPYVRIHHLSDIFGGAVTGVLLGRLALQIFRRLGIRP